MSNSEAMAATIRKNRHALYPDGSRLLHQDAEEARMKTQQTDYSYFFLI